MVSPPRSKIDTNNEYEYITDFRACKQKNYKNLRQEKTGIIAEYFFGVRKFLKRIVAIPRSAIFYK